VYAPLVERAVEVDHVRITGVDENLGRAGGSDSGAAVQQERGITLRRDLTDASSDLAEREQRRVGNVTGIPLHRLPDVDDAMARRGE
jgi:hypothetical protein